jgi:hypothetical protein
MSKAIMARGWESKAVEDQIQEAEAAKSEASAAALVALDASQNKYKIDALRLTRSRLNEQLRNSRSVAHRQMLHTSLRAIDEEIAALEAKS